MLRKLPPIFSRVRFSISKADQPPIVVRLGADEIDVARMFIRGSPDDVELSVKMWAHIWIETPHLGMLCYSREDDSSDVMVWNARGGDCVRYHFAQVLDEPGDDLFRIVKAQFYQAAVALHLLEQRERDVSVNTLTRNKPSAWTRVGDTMRFVPLSSLASGAGHSRQRDYQPPSEPSGIRMREHDVRGHWRTYSSGVRVWVRSHKRGDPELGRVTRVIGG